MKGAFGEREEAWSSGRGVARSAHGLGSSKDGPRLASRWCILTMIRRKSTLFRLVSQHSEHKSIPFNPDIARVFYLRKLMDQLGVGTQRVTWECKELGSKGPIWRVQKGMVFLTLFRVPEPALGQDLGTRQAEFVASLRDAAKFKAGDYAAATGVSDRQARRDLADLEEQGVIERHGKGKATVYRRVAEA